MQPLPAEATSFIGREHELAEIARLLADPACRLLTLIGAGGIGKTRLALQAAADQEAHFADGAVFVALTAIESPDFLPASIGAALEIPFFSLEEPLLQIEHYLRDKHVLLVMDNFEQLLDGADVLTDLLNAASRLKILVTSRERLNVQEEWIFPLDGLAYPATSNTPSSENYGAVQLFAQRARQIQHHFALGEHLPAVLSICRQVEGMPLGLELAASWLHVMSCEQIAARMASNLDFLTTSLRNVPERHRSLIVIFQQSWTLLSADEQAVLMRLSLFHGGFDFETAIEVADATLSVLAGLTNKSLLRMDAGGRYDLHELLRQYAGEKLAQAGEVRATTQRHLACFMKLAEAGEAHAYGREQAIWYDRQEAEMDNLRAALNWAIRDQEIENGLRTAAALRWVWEMRGHLEEGLNWFKKLLPHSQAVPPSVRGKALHRASELAGQMADEAQAALWAEEALRLARSRDDRWNLAWALSAAGYFSEPDTDKAVAMLRESLALFREIQDPLGLSHALRRLAGRVMEQGEYETANDLLEEALAHDRPAGDQNATAWDLCFKGVALWRQHHDPRQVIPLYQESIGLFEAIQDLRGKAHPLVMLAEAERMQGHLARSHAHLQEALRLEHDLGIRDNLTLFALAGIASLSAKRGKAETAARWLGIVQAALHSDAYRTRLSALTDVFDSMVAEARERLDAETFNAAWAAGNAMPLEQAITEALLDEPIEMNESNHSLPDPLSARESEVLRLLGVGLSNAEIAQTLVISVTTVKAHTRSIYGKLNVGNRTQAIIQARELNLL